MKPAHHIAHIFFPRESNNHKAKILHPSGILLVTFIVVLAQLVLGSQKYFQGKVLGYAANIPPAEVIRLTNLKRIDNGLSPLTENKSLMQGAFEKGRDMLAKGYWSHISPDGTQPWKFFNDVSYTYRYAGENLARDFADSQSAVNAWMNSPTHRENLLSLKYNDIGVAVVEGNLGGVDTTIIVQFFGTRIGESLPVPTVAPAVNSFSISANSETPSALVSPLSINKKLTIFVVGFLVVILLLDWGIVAARRITRVSGRPLAHTAFLGMILAIVLIAKAGKIL